MKRDWAKILIIGVLCLAAGIALGLVYPAAAQTTGGNSITSDIWRIVGGYIVPSNANRTVKIATTTPLRLSALNCTTYTNNGVLTTDSNGYVVCDDDDGGAGGGGGSSTPAGITNSLQYKVNATTFGGSQIFQNSGYFLGQNSTTPTANLVVQGTSTVPTANVLIVATNTGVSLLTVAANGSTTLSSLGTGLVRSTSGSLYTDSQAYVLASRLINTTAPITGGGDLSADRTIACNVASGSQAGCLASADWTTFNGKLTSISALTGPVIHVATTSDTNILISVSTSTANTLIFVPGWTGTLSVARGGTGANTLTANSLLLGNGTSAISASSLSQVAGTTFINGVTPIINGGGIWISDIVQTSGANFIVQTPTSTAVLGNLIQGGGVQQYNASANLTATQFCTGGLAYVSSSTALTITLPALSQLGIGLAPTNCTGAIYSGNFAQQYITNTGTAAVTTATSGTLETLLYAPGSGAITYPGQATYAVGQFIASSTIVGSTSTGMSLNVYLQQFQPRATNPIVQGQFLSASTTGAVNEWLVTNFVAGSNITITTTTPGQITIASSGGGSGNSAWTIGTKMIYNATSTDVVGIGTSTPAAILHVVSPSTTIATLVAQATTSQTSALFDLWSATGSSLFNVTSGNVNVATLTANSLLRTDGSKNLQSVSAGTPGFAANWTSASLIGTGKLMDNGTLLGYNATSTSYGVNIQATAAVSPFNVASSSGTSIFTVASSSLVGIGSTVPQSLLTVQGSSGQTAPLFTVASSSAAALLQVNNSTYANVAIGTSTGQTANLFVQGSTVAPTANLFDLASSSGANLLTVTSKGRAGINSSTPNYLLSVNGTVAITGISAFATGDSAVCWRATGELTVDSGVSSCIVSSMFTKDFISEEMYLDAKRKIDSLRVITFKYKDSGKEDIGLYAEDVAKVDSRYAQYAEREEIMDGHTFHKGDPKAINWTAIQADMIVVLQHQQQTSAKINYLYFAWVLLIPLILKKKRNELA